MDKVVYNHLNKIKEYVRQSKFLHTAAGAAKSRNKLGDRLM